MQLLDQAYNREAYLAFLTDKFTFCRNLSPIPTDNNEVENFQQLGFITTPDDKQLPVFEIHIKPNTYLSRNRVQLRNLVAKQIGSEDGALAVYVDEKNRQWRFSFIAIEYRFTDEGVKKEQTASKRFTYLLGENTNTRTAKKRFEKLNQQSTLDNLKQAFSVETLSNEFYKALYKWYGKAQTQVVFPNDEQAENHTQTSLIRLLTRLLFIWFIKEKSLINPDLFDQAKLQTLIDYDKPSSFYKAILQNLFFATLNRQISKRGFRTTTNGAANGTNYLATNVYRYQHYFTCADKNGIIALFEQTPFLNGGLFECLDHEASDAEKQDYDNDHSIRPVASAIRVDGFSDRPDNELVFHNQLFFNDDEQDLGLIDLLNQYQFTVEESTPLDVEVALDPELLGKVFENLLASYNPETGEQARKATGSFYTPREIVSYMVDESIKAYLLEKVARHDGDTEFYQQRLSDLITQSDTTGEADKDDKPLTYPEEIPELIKAISTLKIIDPAVGSGAFPMGILQRLVALLNILDSNNEGWKKQKLAELPDLQSIETDLKTSDQISDTKAKQKAQQILNTKKQDIISTFENQDHNYLRKLYLIEQCIYGVDIQPIAIQICKLRFFISLTIEQTPNQNENDNYGIQALPNLETKFIVANSLLPLAEMPKQGDMFKRKIEALQQQLAEVRHNNFSAKTLTTKRKYRDKDKELRQELYQSLLEYYQHNAVWEDAEKIVNIKKHKLLKNKKNYQNKINTEKQTQETLFQDNFNSPNTNSASDKEKQNWQDKIIELDKNIASEEKIMLLISRHDESIKKENIWQEAEATAKENAEKIYVNVQKIATWDLYNQNAVADWFDPEWQFGIKDGFDIVIGNPPYIKTEYIPETIKEQLKNNFVDKKGKNWVDDLYCHFIFKAFELSKRCGIVVFITNDSFIGLKSKERVRDLLCSNNNLIALVACPYETFNATIYTAIFIVKKDDPQPCYQALKFLYPNYKLEILGTVEAILSQKLPYKKLVFPSQELDVYKKVQNYCHLGKFINILDTGIHSGNVRKKIFFKQPNPSAPHRLLQGKHISRYKIQWSEINKGYKYCNSNYRCQPIKGVGRGGKVSARNEYWKFCGDEYNHHLSERLLLRQTDDDLVATHHCEIEHGQFYTDNTLHTITSKKSKNFSVYLMFILAIINSKLLNSLYHLLSQEQGKTLAQVKTGIVEQLPIPKVSKLAQQPFIELVDKILTAKQHSQDTRALETKIDEMVYKLYNLTDDEIKIIENNTTP